jgi:hypothetical protein
MEEHARGKDFFNTEAFPKITYKGRISKWNGDAPAAVEGEMTLLGVTKPLNLTINSFKCIQHPMLKREVCGTQPELQALRLRHEIRLADARRRHESGIRSGDQDDSPQHLSEMPLSPLTGRRQVSRTCLAPPEPAGCTKPAVGRRAWAG